jgi:hypothetical protein
VAAALPMGCGPTWTRHARPRRQRRSAWRTLPKQGRPPPAAPDKRAPPGNRLARGPWRGLGQGHPLYRRAVPGQRHGDSPASCRCKPCARRWPSGARSRQDQREPRPADPLLAKPDRAGSPAGDVVIAAGRGCRGIVRGCPPGTGQDRCEWHGSGTAGDDVARAWRCRHQLHRR